MPKANQFPPVYVGIDPGASGGVAFVSTYFDRGAENFGLSSLTDRQVCEWLDIPGTAGPFGASRPPITFAVIEQNTGYVGGGGNPGSAMFKFGLSAGKLLGYLVALNIPYEMVTPRTWQKALGISARKRTESKVQFKNRLKQHAERLFPGVCITLATCDALLIAEYCHRKREGKL